MRDEEVGGFSTRRIVVLVVCGLLALATLICSGKLLESIDAGEIMVVQAPWSGKLTWYTTPGIKWQGFGEVTKYPKRGQFWFYNQNDPEDTSKGIRVQFNDSGSGGTILGSVACELPLAEDKLTAMHSRYKTWEAMEQQLVKPVIDKSIFLVGPLMSSKESMAERRNELLYLIEDQIQNGVYRTKQIRVEQEDLVTGQKKMVNVVELIEDKQGGKQRAEKSPLAEFDIRVFNLSIARIKYDANVEQQFQKQQEATMQIQLAIAQAKEAEQRSITAAKDGEANAAKAKWEQEVLKARAVVEAQQIKEVAELSGQQRLVVAKLDREAAEQEKQKQILLGEGEATRKKAVMTADGALTQKLEAWLQAQKFFAEAIKDHKGQLVPTVVMSGSGGTTNSDSPLQTMMELFSVKTAKDLALDMSFTPNSGNQIIAAK